MRTLTRWYLRSIILLSGGALTSFYAVAAFNREDSMIACAAFVFGALTLVSAWSVR